MRTLLFHSNQLSLRGTEIALYDYAHYNEKLLHNRSIIAIKRQGQHDPQVKKKFEDRFKVFYYDSLEELQKFADSESVDIFYALKSGENDGLLLKGIKNCVHVVFCHNDPHGDVYAYVSEWLAQTASAGRFASVPHMVSLPQTEGDLRKELKIPESALVFGRYGGSDTFDIPFVKRVIYRLALRRPDMYFVFMNTDDFLERKTYFRQKQLTRLFGRLFFPRDKLNNVIFLEGSSDLERKVRFIKTCDAMLHARTQGESFGIACGEFSIFNKPVITCNAPWVADRNHLRVLGEKGLYFATASALTTLLEEFKKSPDADWDAYGQDFNPRAVMEKFKNVFVEG